MAAEAQAPTTERAPTPRVIRTSIRWKLLTAFAGAFTIIFVFIAIWIFQYTSYNAAVRLETELASSAEGGAKTIDAVEFATLNATVAPVPDPDNKHGLGYPDDPLYESVASQLYDIRLIVKDAGVYSYFKDPADGRLYFSASAGYLLDPQTGVTFKVPVDEVVGPSSYALMEQGLERTTNEPAYEDAFGSWISAYTPIRDADGVSIGGLGLDYPQTYVGLIQDGVRQQLFPVLAGSYIVLLLMVLMLSTTIARPLKKLTVATRRVADGEYDLDVRGIVQTHFPDEMATLAESFAEMAAKVAQRERSLTREVQRLKVEIDHARREEAVKEITESDFFSDLTAKAAELRRRAREGG